jgi:hypothetical protein
MSGMSGHMTLTPPRPTQPGDQAKADAIVAAAKTALAPYQDYHKAEADGYRIFLPNSVGWSTSIPTRPTRKTSGRRATTMPQATTTWPIQRCQE